MAKEKKNACPYCDGGGRIWVENELDKEEYEFNCPACEGTGKSVQQDVLIVCPFCTKGEIELENTETSDIKSFLCPACHGSCFVSEDVPHYWAEEG